MSCNESMFKSLTKMDISVLVDLLDGTTKEVTKIGEVTLNGFITLHEVFFVIPGNLIIILIDNPSIRAPLGHNQGSRLANLRHKSVTKAMSRVYYLAKQAERGASALSSIQNGQEMSFQHQGGIKTLVRFIQLEIVRKGR